jgi:hypothetical protein
VCGELREELTERTLSDSLARRESPHPNTENGGNDKRDPAYAHWNCMAPDNDLGVLDQSQEMTNGKDGENDARDA